MRTETSRYNMLMHVHHDVEHVLNRQHPSAVASSLHSMDRYLTCKCRPCHRNCKRNLSNEPHQTSACNARSPGQSRQRCTWWASRRRTPVELFGRACDVKDDVEQGNIQPWADDDHRTYLGMTNVRDGDESWVS